MTSGPCAARTAAEDAGKVEDGLASVDPNMVVWTLPTSESACGIDWINHCRRNDAGTLTRGRGGPGLAASKSSGSVGDMLRRSGHCGRDQRLVIV